MVSTNATRDCIRGIGRETILQEDRKTWHKEDPMWRKKKNLELAADRKERITEIERAQGLKEAFIKTAFLKTSFMKTFIKTSDKKTSYIKLLFTNTLFFL
jgi:hypothetical protein